VADSKAAEGKRSAPDTTAAMKLEDEVAYIAKRHRISPAIVREIIRSTGLTERVAIEREIQKGKARR